MKFSEENFYVYGGKGANNGDKDRGKRETAMSGRRANGVYVIENGIHSHRLSLNVCNESGDDSAPKKSFLAILMNPSQAGTKLFDLNYKQSTPWVEAPTNSTGYRNMDSTVNKLFMKIENDEYSRGLIINTSSHIEMNSSTLGADIGNCYCAENRDMFQRTKKEVNKFIASLEGKKFDLLIATGKFTNNNGGYLRMRSYFKLLDFLNKRCPGQYTVKATKQVESSFANLPIRFNTGSSISRGESSFYYAKLVHFENGIWDLSMKEPRKS